MGVEYSLEVGGHDVEVSWTPEYKGISNREPGDCAPSEPSQIELLCEIPSEYLNREDLFMRLVEVEVEKRQESDWDDWHESQME